MLDCIKDRNKLFISNLNRYIISSTDVSKSAFLVVTFAWLTIGLLLLGSISALLTSENYNKIELDI